MAKTIKISGYTKKGYGRRIKVRQYHRRNRPKGKRRIISKKPVRLYPIRDEYGMIHGYSTKR